MFDGMGREDSSVPKYKYSRLDGKGIRTVLFISLDTARNYEDVLKCLTFLCG